MQSVKGNIDAALYGTSASLVELLDLRKHALTLPSSATKKFATLDGQTLTKTRGRGIEFDATREYHPGDDIRRMAWRVSARSGKPHIKVYCEEKERPVWLAIDLSPSLYFGTRGMFKSVRSIYQATLAGWSLLLKRERLGAVICQSLKAQIYQPYAGEKYYLTILKSLAQASTIQPSSNSTNYLYTLLHALEKTVQTGHVVYLYSDFFNLEDDSKQLMIHLSRYAQIVLNFIYDPFEASPPPPGEYILTDGTQKTLFNMRDKKNRHEYQQRFKVKVRQLKNFAARHQMRLQLYCTDPSWEEK